MAIIYIDSLASGMVLQERVCDRSGRMLLPAGVVLTENHLSIFRAWNVVEVDVITDGDSAGAVQSLSLPEELDPQQLAAAEAELSPLFVHNDLTHPVVKELFRLCAARRVVNVR